MLQEHGLDESIYWSQSWERCSGCVVLNVQGTKLHPSRPVRWLLKPKLACFYSRFLDPQCLRSEMVAKSAGYGPDAANDADC